MTRTSLLALAMESCVAGGTLAESSARYSIPQGLLRRTDAKAISSNLANLHPRRINTHPFCKRSPILRSLTPAATLRAPSDLALNALLPSNFDKRGCSQSSELNFDRHGRIGRGRTRLARRHQRHRVRIRGVCLPADVRLAGGVPARSVTPAGALIPCNAKGRCAEHKARNVFSRAKTDGFLQGLTIDLSIAYPILAAL